MLIKLTGEGSVLVTAHKKHTISVDMSGIHNRRNNVAARFKVPPIDCWAAALRSDHYTQHEHDWLRSVGVKQVVQKDNLSYATSGLTYSAVGVLCELYLKCHPCDSRQGHWRGNATGYSHVFVWRHRGKSRRARRGIPQPIWNWWRTYHPDLPLYEMRDMLKDRQLAFNQLADLLEVRAPWAMLGGRKSRD